MKTEDDEGGMSYAAIQSKHLRLRGTEALRYPDKEDRCGRSCGLGDLPADGKREARDHPCFLGPHEGPCEFSSECGEMKCH